MDGSNKVSEITANTVGAADKTVAVTAVDCAASINATGPASTRTLVLTGSAASQNTNIVVLGGLVNILNTNLTGTNTINATMDTTVTSGVKDVTADSGGDDYTIGVTATGGSVLLQCPATVNGIKMGPNAITTVTVAGADELSVVGGNTQFTLAADTDSANKTFNFTGAGLQSGNISVSTSSTSHGLSLTAAAALSECGITVTGGKVIINAADHNFSGTTTINNDANVVFEGVTISGTAGTVYHSGVATLSIGGTVGNVLVDDASAITNIKLQDAAVVGSLTNSKAAFASLTVEAGSSLTSLTVDAAKKITKLTNAGTITNLTVNGGIDAVSLGATGVITNAVIMGVDGYFKVDVDGGGLQTFANTAGNIIVTAADFIITSTDIKEIAGTAGSKFAVQVTGNTARAEIVAKTAGAFGTTIDIAAAQSSTPAPAADVNVKILNTAASFSAL